MVRTIYKLNVKQKGQVASGCDDLTMQMWEIGRGRCLGEDLCIGPYSLFPLIAEAMESVV